MASFQTAADYFTQVAQVTWPPSPLENRCWLLSPKLLKLFASYASRFSLKVVPIPREKIDEAKTAFMEYGQLQNLELANIPEEKDLQEASLQLVAWDGRSRLLSVLAE